MIGEQIKQIIDLECIKVREFERMIGATQGVINKCIKGKTDVSCTIAANIVRNFPQYSPYWLLTGEGSMMKDGASIEVDNLPYKELYNDMKIEFTKIMGHLEQVNKDQKSIIEAQKALIDKLMTLNRD